MNALSVLFNYLEHKSVPVYSLLRLNPTGRCAVNSHLLIAARKN